MRPVFPMLFGPNHAPPPPPSPKRGGWQGRCQGSMHLWQESYNNVVWICAVDNQVDHLVQAPYRW